jgi:hypothetical protein
VRSQLYVALDQNYITDTVFEELRKKATQSHVELSDGLPTKFRNQGNEVQAKNSAHIETLNLKLET